MEIKPIPQVLRTILENSNGNSHAPLDDEGDDYLLSNNMHDEGNAQCTAHRYPGQFTYNDAFGWLAYNGKYFVRDGGEQRLDRAIVETLTERINAILQSGDERSIKAIGKLAPTSGRVSGAKALLESIVYASDDQFDKHPDLLNCQNGVVDLRTGVLSDHSSEYRFTYCINAAYDPNADYSAWTQFLLGTVIKPEIIDWLQMAVGYSLTGHTREEILFYLYGPTRSGKGTFTETILTLLGQPLSTEIGFGTFTAQRNGDSQNFDLAPLKACRFVAASESNAYERFNEAKIKALTGGNDVYCAFKHKTHFSYRPQFKIWLSSNQQINADPDDDAVWGRVRLIDFPISRLGNEDKSLKYDLKKPANLAGVLRWAIDGAMRWYQLGDRGLPELTASLATKTNQREELDSVGQWIDECCTQGGYTGNDALYASYMNWCRANGVPPKQQKGLAQSLKRKGYDIAPKWDPLAHKTVRRVDGLTVL